MCAGLVVDTQPAHLSNAHATKHCHSLFSLPFTSLLASNSPSLSLSLSLSQFSRETNRKPKEKTKRNFLIASLCFSAFRLFYGEMNKFWWKCGEIRVSFDWRWWFHGVESVAVWVQLLCTFLEEAVEGPCLILALIVLSVYSNLKIIRVNN